ncbi:hypothetical protein EB118_03045 [bacterium]|nr:hypothetical protein [bacterium]NDC93941.1 hypothetical protein [bacterium]NDD83436.1 hypothetical protein [bacterium]NDG29061.1 hypothetical protein [bacterium]
MPFWRNKPVTVEPCEKMFLLPRAKLYQMATTEMQNVIGVTYTMLDLGNPEHMSTVIVFLYNYYNSAEDHNKFAYTKEIIQHFIIDTEYIALLFYVHTEPVGIVMSARRNLVYKGQRISACENNFLAVIQKYRKRGVNAFMMNALTKECVQRWPVDCAMYTVSKTLPVRYYTSKSVYIKPINIPMFKKCTILNNYTPITNTTSNSQKVIKFIRNNHFENEYYKNMTRKVNEYSQANYLMYFLRSVQEIRDTFCNKSMYAFVATSNGEITDYVSFSVVPLRNSSGITCRCGYFYTHFFEHGSDKLQLLDNIHKIVYDLDLFDLATYIDPFGYTVDQYNQYGIVCTSGKLNYYAYNLCTTRLSPGQVGLYTL